MQNWKNTARNDEAEVGVRITQLTANKYHRVLRYLKEYVAAHYKKEDILLSAVGYEFLDGFNTFLQTAHNCKHNGAVNLLDCVKNFTRYCLRNEWIEKDPFRNYKLKEEHNKEKDHLTREELETLIRKKLPNERLDRIRDVFAFVPSQGWLLPMPTICARNISVRTITEQHGFISREKRRR